MSGRRALEVGAALLAGLGFVLLWFGLTSRPSPDPDDDLASRAFLVSLFVYLPAMLITVAMGLVCTAALWPAWRTTRARALTLGSATQTLLCVWVLVQGALNTYLPALRSWATFALASTLLALFCAAIAWAKAPPMVSSPHEALRP